jgi:hypothetical protein
LNFDVADYVKFMGVDSGLWTMSMSELTLDGGQIGCVFNSQETSEGVAMMRENLAFGDEEQSAGIVLHYQIMIKAGHNWLSTSIR